MTVDPRAFALPQDLVDRARGVAALLANNKSFRPLRRRFLDLALRPNRLADAVFCDGHLGLQVGALLQRPTTQWRLSPYLRGLEVRAREAMSIMLSGPSPAARIHPSPSRPPPAPIDRAVQPPG